MAQTRILIIENDKIAAEEIQYTLEQLGYQVAAVACSGPEAIETVKATRPDLVLMQLRLKGDKESLEAAAQIKAQFELPVIYLTADTGDAVWQQAQVAEPFGYVLKPFRPRELHLAIEATLYQVATTKKLLVQPETSPTLTSFDQIDAPDKRFRIMADTVPVLIWMSGPDGGCTFFNKFWLSFTGRTMEQELGNGWSESIHADDYVGYFDAYQAALAAQREFLMEYRLRRADGVYRWVVSDGIPHFENDNFCGYTGSCIDITELKQIEEAYRIHDRAIAATQNGITIADASQPDLPLIYCNPAFEQITGYSRNEVIGLSCRFLQGPDTDPAVLEQIRQALRLGRECRVELKNYRKDGTPFWNELILSPVRDEAGQLTHFVGIQNDVTNRKQSEERLRAGEERFRRVISSISDHIYVTQVTADGRLHNLYLSPHVEALTGYSIENFMADWKFWPSTVIHPNDRGVATAQADQLIQGTNSEAEYRIIRADGQTIWVRDSGRAERQGTATFIYGVVSNITKRKLLEEQLRQSQKMEAVGRLAGGVAHDFNNLLTVIIGDCDLILNSGDYHDETLLEDVANIKSAGERAAALTQQLLAFSRKQNLEPQILDLNTIVSGVENLLRRLIGAHIELDISLDSQLKPVKVDRHQLEQVIVNLAVNARDAMPKRGRLTIRTTNDVQTFSSAEQLIPPGNYVKLSVEDNGVGMDAKTVSRIFEPFFTTKKQGEGTGLGLATVYGIIQQSGGHISVSSEPGLGTTFNIYLPQATAISEKVKRLSSKPVTRSAGHSETILLVEDETRVRSIIRKFLQKAGYKVLEAQSSEAALQFCEGYEGPIDLLVTDVMMPGLSGPELAKQLLSVRPTIKILYVSGYTDDLLAQQTLTPGAALLQKPFNPDTLARTAWELLHSSRDSNGQ